MLAEEYILVDISLISLYLNKKQQAAGQLYISQSATVVDIDR